MSIGSTLLRGPRHIDSPVDGPAADFGDTIIATLLADGGVHVIDVQLGNPVDTHPTTVAHDLAVMTSLHVGVRSAW